MGAGEEKDPTVHFAVSKPHTPSIGVSKLHRIRRSIDYVPSGRRMPFFNPRKYVESSERERERGKFLSLLFFSLSGKASVMRSIFLWESGAFFSFRRYSPDLSCYMNSEPFLVLAA